MGLDCTYQAIPSHLDIIKKAIGDEDYAYDVFYSLIAFCDTIDEDPYHELSENQEIKEILKNYPDIKEWCFNPASRAHDALVYTLDPDNFCRSNNFETLEKTFPYQYVMGEKVFSSLVSTQDVPVRYSSHEFIQKCSDFSKTISMVTLKKNFDAMKMKKIGVYKVIATSPFEWVYSYFKELSEFYQKMSSIGK